jgi:hypothetical protein
MSIYISSCKFVLDRPTFIELRFSTFPLSCEGFFLIVTVIQMKTLLYHTTQSQGQAKLESYSSPELNDSAHESNISFDSFDSKIPPFENESRAHWGIRIFDDFRFF